MRRVTITRRTREPSSTICRSDFALTRFLSLSRSRVMPKAAVKRPGPEVIFRRSRSERTRTPRARAISSIPATGSSARSSTHPGDFVGKTGNVQAVMIAVDEIHIRVSRRTKQHSIARRPARCRMRCPHRLRRDTPRFRQSAPTEFHAAFCGSATSPAVPARPCGDRRRRTPTSAGQFSVPSSQFSVAVPRKGSLLDSHYSGNANHPCQASLQTGGHSRAEKRRRDRIHPTEN